MSRILKLYQNVLKKYPTCVHGVQAGILMGTGDQLAQNFVERRQFKDVDFVRTAQFAGIGCFIAGPALHTWFHFLQKRIGSQTRTSALKKVLVDQICFPPAFLALLLTLISMTKGNDIDQIKQKFKNDYPGIMLNNYKLWPMVQLINFYFVRLEYQALVVQAVALFWNTYFSYSAYKESDPQQESSADTNTQS